MQKLKAPWLESEQHPNTDRQHHNHHNHFSKPASHCHALSTIRPRRSPTLPLPISHPNTPRNLTTLPFLIQRTTNSRAIPFPQRRIRDPRVAARRARHRDFRPVVQSRAEIRNLVNVRLERCSVVTFQSDSKDRHSRFEWRSCCCSWLRCLSVSRGDAVEADVGWLEDVDGDGWDRWQDE